MGQILDDIIPTTTSFTHYVKQLSNNFQLEIANNQDAQTQPELRPEPERRRFQHIRTRREYPENRDPWTCPAMTTTTVCL